MSWDRSSKKLLRLGLLMLMALLISGQRDEQGCTQEELEMAFSNPPDGWEVYGTNATWGTDVLEDNTLSITGLYSILITGDSPATVFGIKNTSDNFFPLEKGGIYRFTCRLRSDSVVAGRTVTMSVNYWNGDKSGVVGSITLHNAVLSAANIWLTYTIEFSPTVATARYGQIQIGKTAAFAHDVNFDYAIVIREPMSFSAYLSADQALVTGGFRLVIFDTEYTLASGTAHDLGSNYNAATGVFTAPYRAIYHFEASVSLETLQDGDIFAGRFYVNGASYRQGFSMILGGVHQPADSGSVTLELDAGDTIDFRVYHDRGVNVDANGGSDDCNFSGFEVSR